MADLNQMTKRVESGRCDLSSYRGLMSYLIKEYEEKERNDAISGPICCFYNCSSSRVSECLRLEGFRSFAEHDEDEVIGCSRGCLPIAREETSLILRRFGEQLCKGCVEDAKRLIEQSEAAA